VTPATPASGPLRLGGQAFPPSQLLLMAIVNRTPDSFFQPGLTRDERAAMERVHEVVAQGADIVDVGGVPAKPGQTVEVTGEIRRVVPFVAAVHGIRWRSPGAWATWRPPGGRSWPAPRARARSRPTCCITTTRSEWPTSSRAWR
jgi:dihydropteroate synthase